MSSVQDELTEIFLQQFFSYPNLLVLTKIRQKQNPLEEFIAESISRLTKDRLHFAILPYYRKEDECALWCALAFNYEQANDMRSALKAFVGDTYSDIRSNGIIKDNTPIGKAINQFIDGGYAFKFNGNIYKVMEALRLMYTIQSRTPLRTIRKYNSSSNLLRSINYALLAKDEQEALRIMRLIEEKKFLDATNQLFLKVQIKSVFQQWESLYQHEKYFELLEIRRPKAVTLNLIEVLYHIKVKDQLESTLDVKQIISYFNRDVLPTSGNLFHTWINTDRPEVLKMWMIKLLGSNENDRNFYEQIVSKAQEIELDDSIWQALLSYQEKGETIDLSPETAKELMESFYMEGNLQLAKDYACLSFDSPTKAEVLFRYALRYSEANSFNDYIKVINNLTLEERQFVEHRVSHTFRLIPEEQSWAKVKEPLPTNWIELIERINRDEIFASTHAVSFAEETALEWSYQDFKSKEYSIDLLNKALTATNSEQGERILKRILPYLLNFLQSEKNVLTLLEIYNTIFDLIVISDGLGRGELLTLNELIELILSQGVSKKRYQEIINCIRDISDYYESPYTINCLVDTLDIVLQFAIVSKDDVINLLILAKSLINKVERINGLYELKQLFNNFCAYLDINTLEYNLEQEEVLVKESSWSFYQNKKIGIYTLTEGAARRAESFLVSIGGRIDVKINHDYAGSDALRDMAREADVLVVVTGSAKHAATNFIKQYRGDKPVLYPAGKGSSSIIAVLKDYALQ